MEKAVISEKLLELVAGRQVVAALFTTYTFEPDFFELEVIPLLLNQDIPYSTDERVKRFQVRENLREADLPLEVFYDLPIYRQSGETSPEMEYLYHGVNLGNRAFHGKVNMLLLKDTETDEEALLVGAGSNNLSRAGWWDNIECQHWEEVRDGETRRRFINLLQEDIAFLRSKRPFVSSDQPTALEFIEEYLTNCKGSRSASPVMYYGLSFLDNRRDFTEYLTSKQSPLTQYNNWNLEIISPFFADDAQNVEHETFLDMGVVDIKLLLPIDDEGNALCQESYYSHILEQEGIQWARWQENLAKSLGLTGEHFRRLHAKVYHFYNKMQSWVFVGSVNFTYKALHENVEAGFLVKLDKAGPLLEPIPKTEQIDKFGDLDEKVPGQEIDETDISELPELHLQYDWITKSLIGRSAPYREYEIQILTPEGDAAIEPWQVRNKEEIYEGDTSILEQTLKNGSLVKVKGINFRKKTPFPEHQVLLQQVGWSHKPLELPKLTPEQILAIYADMDPERRQLMLLNAKIRALVLADQGGELTTHQDEQLIDQFFCEYAEIFNAFMKLKRKLLLALEAGQNNQVDYYLTGTGVDSLPSLIERAYGESEEGEILNGVTTYLLLLCAYEIFKDKNFLNRPNIKELSKRVLEALNDIKGSRRLILEDDSRKNRDRFFTWFEGEFFKTYISLPEIPAS